MQCCECLRGHSVCNKFGAKPLLDCTSTAEIDDAMELPMTCLATRVLGSSSEVLLEIR